MRWIFASLVLASALSVATAQPKAKPNPAADAALQEGRRLYDVQDWEAAIAKFKEAYKLRPDAASLFNIAQSYRLKGDCAAAAIQYRTYRRNYPGEKNIDKVDKFIVEMDECAAKVQANVQAQKPTEPVEPPTGRDVKTVIQPVDVPLPPPPPKASPVLRWGGVAVIGVGAIGLGLGVKFALDGRGAEADLAEACARSCPSEVALGLEEDGRAANRRAWGATAIGGAAVIGGVVMFVLSRPGSSEAARVSITPTSGGAVAGYAGSF